MNINYTKIVSSISSLMLALLILTGCGKSPSKDRLGKAIRAEEAAQKVYDKTISVGENHDIHIQGHEVDRWTNFAPRIGQQQASFDGKIFICSDRTAKCFFAASIIDFSGRFNKTTNHGLKTIIGKWRHDKAAGKILIEFPTDIDPKHLKDGRFLEVDWKEEDTASLEQEYLKTKKSESLKTS